jgi:hypothetical protein
VISNDSVFKHVPEAKNTSETMEKLLEKKHNNRRTEGCGVFYAVSPRLYTGDRNGPAVSG